MRCKLDEQQAIVAGAEAAGQTVSAFMRAAAVDRAERLLTIAEAAEARGETFSEFYEAAAMRRAEQVLGKKRF